MITIPEELNWHEQDADCLARWLFLEIKFFQARRWMANRLNDRLHLEEQKLQQWRGQ